MHQGFKVVTNLFATMSKKGLFWVIGFLTFFLLAILNNLTQEQPVHNMAYFLYNMIQALMAMASMVVISPSLMACISVPLPVLLRGCTAYYGQHIRHWMGWQLDVLTRSTHVAMERFGGISTVISFSQRRIKEQQYSDIIEASYGFMQCMAIHKGVFWGSSLLGSHQVLGGEILPDHLIIIPLCKRISASGDKSEGGGQYQLRKQGSRAMQAQGGAQMPFTIFFNSTASGRSPK